MNIFLSILLMLFTIKYCMAQSFNGFYAGVAAHHTSRNIQTTFPSQTTTHHNTTHQLSSIDKNSKADYKGISLLGGYGQSKHDIYYGIEGGIETPNAPTRHSFSSLLSSPLAPIPLTLSTPPSTPISPTANTPFTVAGQVPGNSNSASSNVSSSTRHISTTFKQGWTISIAPRIGIIIKENHLLYFKISIDGSSNTLTHTISHDNPASIDHKTVKKWQVSIAPGIGMEKTLPHNIICRAEYSYNLGTSLKINEASTKYKSHKFKAGLVYQF